MICGECNCANWRNSMALYVRPIALDARIAVQLNIKVGSVRTNRTSQIALCVRHVVELVIYPKIVEVSVQVRVDRQVTIHKLKSTKST